MTEEYEERIKQGLLIKEPYTFVEALEEVTDFWSYGRSIYSLPANNIYVPSRVTVMPKPKFNDNDNRTESLRFNESRVSKIHDHSSMKKAVVYPAVPERIGKERLERRRTFKKYRRLSKYNFTRNFSTFSAGPGLD